MKNLIILYLAMKSLIHPSFRKIEILAALAVAATENNYPSFINLIAGMTEPAHLPEARADIVWEVFHGNS